MLRLSKYFTLDQLCHSDTAEKFNIPNVPTPTEIHNMTLLAGEILDYLYEWYAPSQLHINCCFRCKELNEKVGGSSTSEHLKGLAADLTIEGIEPIEILQAIKDVPLPVYQVIAEKNAKGSEWLHVSYGGEGLQKDFLIATDSDKDGKMEYKRV